MINGLSARGRRMHRGFGVVRLLWILVGLCSLRTGVVIAENEEQSTPQSVLQQSSQPVPQQTASSASSKPPLWQVGVGMGAFSTPYYLGADESQTQVLPALVPIYRGRFFTLDEQGLRSDLISDDHWQLDVSFDGTLGVPSDEVAIRDGMRDLDPVAFAGPSLVYTVDPAHPVWSLELAVRLAVSLNIDSLSGDFRGAVFNPKIIYDTPVTFGGLSPHTWRWKSSLGPLWASRDHNAYYYSVANEYERSDRSAYQAKSGYNGWRLQSSLNYFGPKWLIGVFGRYENTLGAVNAESDLLQRDHNLTLGFAATYFFWSSKRRAQ